MRRVAVFRRAHGLLRTVEQKMVDQMGLTEYSKFVAMQQPVKPVTDKLRDHYGIDECGDDSDKGTVETIRDH
jgi:hypothetical protein